MSEPNEPAGVPAKEDPETLVLRGRPRPVVRFRRGLIIGLTGGVAAILVALSWIALEPQTFRHTVVTGDTGEPAGSGTPEALASAPKNYGDVPRLGPPLPGDLGRPIIEHQRRLDGTEGAIGLVSADRNASLALAERERADDARTAARSSPLIVQLAERARAPEEAAVKIQGPTETPAISPDADGISASQRHKIDFARSSDGTLDPHAVRLPMSPWMLAAGTVIPASLITGLNSDLPGLVLAQVTQNVRDSATGRTILVPQGARLLGKYDSVVAYGQQRALIIWSRILFPDGSSIEIDKVPAVDASGYAGIADRVDAHTWRLIKGIGLSTLLGVGTQLSLGGSEGDLVRAIRESAQQSAAHAGDQLVSRDLDIQPTITARPGWPVRAILNKDLALRPWEP